MNHRGNADGGVFRLGASRLLGHHILFLLRAVGPPRKLTPHQAREALKRVAAGEPLLETALSYTVDHSTILRQLRARVVRLHVGDVLMGGSDPVIWQT